MLEHWQMYITTILLIMPRDVNLHDVISDTVSLHVTVIVYTCKYTHKTHTHIAKHVTFALFSFLSRRWHFMHLCFHNHISGLVIVIFNNFFLARFLGSFCTFFLFVFLSRCFSRCGIITGSSCRCCCAVCWCRCTRLRRSIFSGFIFRGFNRT